MGNKNSGPKGLPKGAHKGDGPAPDRAMSSQRDQPEPVVHNGLDVDECMVYDHGGHTKGKRLMDKILGKLSGFDFQNIYLERGTCPDKCSTKGKIFRWEYRNIYYKCEEDQFEKIREGFVTAMQTHKSAQFGDRYIERDWYFHLEKIKLEEDLRVTEHIQKPELTCFVESGIWFVPIYVQARPGALDLAQKIEKNPKTGLFFWTAGHYLWKRPIMKWLSGNDALGVNQMFFGADICASEKTSPGAFGGCSTKNFKSTPDAETAIYREPSSIKEIYKMIGAKDTSSICFVDDMPNGPQTIQNVGEKLQICMFKPTINDREFATEVRKPTLKDIVVQINDFNNKHGVVDTTSRRLLAKDQRIVQRLMPILNTA